MKKTVAIIAAIVLVIIGGVAAAAQQVTMTIAAAVSSGGGGGCRPPGGTTPSGDLTVSTTSGDQLSLGVDQQRTASLMLATAQTMNASPKALEILVIATLQESKFFIYANTKAYPESANYPHDRDGSDHNSLGPLQQRPAAGWGTVAELMDPVYATQAFLGGPQGPNQGSPRGLFDVQGWEQMTSGAAAQAVQVSAFPELYDKWVPAAQTIISTLATGSSCAVSSGDVALPLEPGYSMTDGFGPRDCPVYTSRGCAASTWHPALDLQHWPNPCGDPVFAVMGGTVTESSRLYLSIRHPDGFVISYLHTYKTERLVDVGAQITAGQQIAVTGNEAPSSGCHLDIRVNVTENTNSKVAALPIDPNAPGWVNPESFMALWGVAVCPPDWCARKF